MRRNGSRRSGIPTSHVGRQILECAKHTLVVQHQGGDDYKVFHDEDLDVWEDWEVPDPELVFMRESESNHFTQVSRNMLPSVL